MTIKTFFVLGAILIVPGKFLEANLNFTFPERELSYPKDDSIPKPYIIRREEYYENPSLLAQDTLKLGESFHFSILGRARFRQVKEISYVLDLGIDSTTFSDLPWKIIIHNTKPLVGDLYPDPCDQARFIRNAQIIDPDRKYSDVAYHFLVATDGSILEGRAMHRMGTHAGRVLEAEQRHDPTLDPDYLAIGIAVVGDFDKFELSEVQKNSLIELVNYLKYFYCISNKDIFDHGEVGECIVHPLGLTTISKKKSCPGIHFPKKKDFFNLIIEDRA